MKPRYLEQKLPKSDTHQILLITGARQTGKTTLAKHQFNKINYFNCDASEIRDRLQNLNTFQWASTIGAAVIDEAQKAPDVFEKIKYAYDEGAITFSVLLGSSQIMLLKNIRETLAGRIALYELYPLMFSEIVAKPNQTLRVPLMNALITSKAPHEILKKQPAFLTPEQEGLYRDAYEHLLKWGGMPKILDMENQQKQKWLQDYEALFLERDLGDLARLDDLQPFRKLQKLAALRAGQLLNYSELARDAGIAADTARRYVEYLRLSYQVILLQPFNKNLTSSTVKSPKIYWTDLGIWRSLTRIWDDTMTGSQFENLVISEIYKWVRTTQANTELYFYRTHGGLEVDLLLKTSHGVIGIEIKNRDHIYSKDYQPLRKVSEKIGNWLASIVIYTGHQLTWLREPNVWYVPVWQLL